MSIHILPAAGSNRLLWRSLLMAALTLCLAAAEAGAQKSARQVSGRGPAVIDSASLGFAGQRLSLYGLRAVAPSQTCAIGDQVWACGQEARWATQNRVGNHWVVCVERARGAGGDILAVCYLGGVGGPELNAWLVEQGWALAERDDVTDYLAQEETARAAGRGLWRGR
ncbi:thermonuclease family protein [Pelagibius litoralis]|uniref:Thermonuclease family protein n=1 Tax=Pelagibius litoralis TaxID=374515 RepID=A0A967EXD4_9PROT|nr:thermonuclease family protein [Pelagibius litoralis]NIA68975.1 thermonuclease family protein [Pelagibius litoralis]